MEAIASVIGSELGDKTLVIHNVKPIWYLKPLQLSQVQPISLTQRPLKGPSPSLLSYCLTVISQNFHLVTPESFQSLPSHLARRVSVRLEADRGYGGETVYPDEATLWAYGAFTNPEETEKDCTVDLPSVVTVTTLSPNPLTNYEHPLVLIPRLFSSPSLSLLTTLTIGGVDDALSDANILSLRWCIQLTCLWTKGCRQLTDSGIRLLASSLELEEKRGPCRLRGWWLHGCGKVSDRSMRSFARWPGLVVLDVRDTSCTTVAMTIFNRSSQALFNGINADFQPCTTGLRALFSSKDPPATILHNLSLTLLKSQDYIALHVKPSYKPIPIHHLPETSKEPKKRSYQPESHATTYLGGGIGQIYGAGVSQMDNPEYDLRESVEVALRFQAEDDHDEAFRAAEKRVPKRLTPCEEAKKMSKEWAARKKKISQAVKTGDWRAVDGPRPKINKISQKQRSADERSRAMVTATRTNVEVDLIQGDERLMMVRMVNEGWEKLNWTKGSGSFLAQMEKENPLPVGIFPTVVAQQPVVQTPVKTKKRSRGKSALVDNIVAVSVPKVGPPAASSQSKPFAAFRPTLKSAALTSSLSSSVACAAGSQPSTSTSTSTSTTSSFPHSNALSQATTMTRNPFRSSLNGPGADSWGLRPSIPLPYPHHEIVIINHEDPLFEGKVAESCRRSKESHLDMLAKDVGSGTTGLEDDHDKIDDLSFDTASSRKRSWGSGGADGGQSVRRGGLKMFSSRK